MRFLPSRSGLVLLGLMVGVLGASACGQDDAEDPATPGDPSTQGTMINEEAGANGRDGSVAPGTDGGGGGATKDGGGGKDSGPDTSELSKRKAQMLTSFWENDTTVFQYAFSRNNNDSYGYTSGRVGFTTATGDAYMIVQCFDMAFGAANNPMKKYEAPLAALYAKKIMTGTPQPDISTLDAVGMFPVDWKATANGAATAPKFDGCQDQRVDQYYWAPAIAIAKKWGLTTALSNASIYDSTIVHGATNVNNIIKQVNIDVGNTAQAVPTAPLSLTAESAWLAKFNEHRTALINSSAAWRGAIARGANYEQQRRNGNFDFSKAIVTDAVASVVFPGNGYSASGYQACSINADGSVTGVAQCTAPVSN